MSELKPTEEKNITAVITVNAAEKPGWKTSEFWLTNLVVLIGILMGSGAFGEGHLVMQVAGYALAALQALGYTAARANVKRTASLERATLGKPQATAE